MKNQLILLSLLFLFGSMLLVAIDPTKNNYHAAQTSSSFNSSKVNLKMSTNNSISGTATKPLTQKQIIQKYAEKYNVNPDIIMAIIRVESGGNPTAHNGINKGLMQICVPSARFYDRSINGKNIYDPETNIRIGTLYFKTLMNQFNNNIVYALAAYNAGSKNTMNWLSQNPNLSITDIP